MVQLRCPACHSSQVSQEEGSGQAVCRDCKTPFTALKEDLTEETFLQLTLEGFGFLSMALPAIGFLGSILGRSSQSTFVPYWLAGGSALGAFCALVGLCGLKLNGLRITLPAVLGLLMSAGLGLYTVVSGYAAKLSGLFG